ncbi:hypothetical protein MMC26_000742 [Xylographa opegraphella]|nr:hypothetical protein [Xylographa opegraphella]
MRIKNNSLELSFGVPKDKRPYITNASYSITTFRRGNICGKGMSQGREKSQVRFDAATKPPKSRQPNGAWQEHSLSGSLQEPGALFGVTTSPSNTHLEPESPSTPIPAILRSSPERTKSREQPPVRRQAESPFVLESEDDIELEELTKVNGKPGGYTRAQLRKARSQKKANLETQNLQREAEHDSFQQYNYTSSSEMSTSSLPHDSDMPFDPIDLTDRLETAPARQNDIDERDGHKEG